MVVTSAEEKMVMQHIPFIFLVLLFCYRHVGVFLTDAPFFLFISTSPRLSTNLQHF